MAFTYHSPEDKRVCYYQQAGHYENWIHIQKNLRDEPAEDRISTCRSVFIWKIAEIWNCNHNRNWWIKRIIFRYQQAIAFPSKVSGNRNKLKPCLTHHLTNRHGGSIKSTLARQIQFSHIRKYIDIFSDI